MKEKKQTDDKTNLKSDHDLDASEKEEIEADVKAAVYKARATSSIIEKANNSNPDLLNQTETDNILNQRTAKAKKRSKIPVIITILLIIVLALIGLYWYLTNNPKTIFTKGVETIFTAFDQNIKENPYDLTSGNISVTYKAEDENSSSLAGPFSLQADYTTDSQNNIFNLDLTTKYDNLDFIKANLYQENNKIYLYSADLYDRYIEFDGVQSADPNTIKIYVNSLKEAVLKAISNEKFYGNKLNITIDNQNVKTYRSSLELTKSNFNTILDNVATNLQNDDKLIQTYTKAYTVTVEQTKAAIQNKITSLKDEWSKLGNITINLYTKGLTNEFVKAELVMEDYTFSISKIDKEKYTYLVNDKETDIQVSGKFTYQNKDKLDAQITINCHQNDIDVLQATLEIQGTTQKGTAIKRPDITNKVTADSLSTDDFMTIYSKLLTNPGVTKLLGLS